jgi:hypothetical protein
MTEQNDPKNLSVINPSFPLTDIIPYDDPSFKGILNSQYAPVQNMQQTVALISETSMGKADSAISLKIDETSIKLLPGTTNKYQWGNYQQICLSTYLKSNSPPITPHLHTLFKDWRKNANDARKDLAKQENFSPVFPGSYKIPRYKLDLLDSIVEICFTECACNQEKPGIPMEIDVSMKSAEDPHPDWHDIEFYWIAKGTAPNQQPVKLYLRMICPFMSRQEVVKFDPPNRA